MSIYGQLMLMVFVIGLIVGAIAALASKGRGVIPYIVSAVIGSILFFYGSRMVFADLRDPYVTTIFASTLGSVIFAALARTFVGK